MVNLAVPFISVAGRTVIFNFQIEGGSTQNDPLHSWRGSTIRDSRDLYSTTRRTVGRAFLDGFTEKAVCTV